MSTTKLLPFLVSETSHLFETSTNPDTSTYHNYSEAEGESKRFDEMSNARWRKSEIFGFIFLGILVFIVVFGIIGNILVFIMMGDKKLSSLSYSIYLRFLAVSDSGLLIVRLFDEFEKTFTIEQLAELKICVISFSIRVLVMNLSPWLVIGLAFDRCVCVCFPMTRGRLCTKKKAIVICSFMLALSFAASGPIPINIIVIEGKCFPSKEIRLYYVLNRLLISSTLPCLIILALNVIIIVEIQRSQNFRNTFIRSSSESASHQDKSTRPLVMVSVLAFITLIPVSLSESLMIILKILEKDMSIQDINSNVWLICFIIYLCNFGQNFYILIGSSSTYRHIIRKQLGCCSFKWKEHSSKNATSSGSGTIGSTRVATASGEAKTTKESSCSAIMTSI